MITSAARTAVVAGFQRTVLPHRAGAVGRFPAMEVKLKGVTAKTKPSRGRSSRRFQVPVGEWGWSRMSWSRKWALKVKKSISSAAASISAWWIVLDWPSMVAALRRAR